MSDPAKVLVVANRTAATPGLIDAVRERAQSGSATFHLVVPASVHGLARVADPFTQGREALLNGGINHRSDGLFADRHAGPLALMSFLQPGCWRQLLKSRAPSAYS